jgi:hypothetical protein
MPNGSTHWLLPSPPSSCVPWQTTLGIVFIDTTVPIYSLTVADFGDEVQAILVAHEYGGGGHQMAGPKHGKYSLLAQTVTFLLKCSSAHAWVSSP